jgi:hypothetical protein
MHAAVITAAHNSPVYREHPEPSAAGDNEMVVDVLAAALHHLTRAKADGSHYSSGGVFPLVPGVDAVVRDPQGNLRYAALDDTNLGTFAERTLIDVRRSILLPEGVDPVRIAAGMNPAMSSWVALRRRIDFQPGQRVLILGATGSAGRMAIQIAKLFAQAMLPLLTARTDRTAPLTWIQIGSIAGELAPIPSVALRAARLQIIGSGIGSITPRDFMAELPELAATLAGGTIDVRARAVPLADIDREWNTGTSDRLVFVP